MSSIPLADSFDFIRARLQEIRTAAVPVCPLNPDRTLFNCLRTSARCPESCPHRGDWIGPGSDG
jgi:hypothetical protein